MFTSFLAAKLSSVSAFVWVSWAQGSVVLGCVATLAFVLWKLNNVNRSVGTLAQAFNMHTVNDIILENRCVAIEARIGEHDKMLAHMAKMRAAKAAKKASKANKISRPAKKVAKTA